MSIIVAVDLQPVPVNDAFLIQRIPEAGAESRSLADFEQWVEKPVSALFDLIREEWARFVGCTAWLVALAMMVSGCDASTTPNMPLAPGKSRALGNSGGGGGAGSGTGAASSMLRESHHAAVPPNAAAAALPAMMRRRLNLMGGSCRALLPCWQMDGFRPFHAVKLRGL
jgi:hypothetical protein